MTEGLTLILQPKSLWNLFNPSPQRLLYLRALPNLLCLSKILQFCFNPLALWALPLYRYATQGERLGSISLLPCFDFKLRYPVMLRDMAGERCTKPFLFWNKKCRSSSSTVFLQRKNIGEVARSDGGIKKHCQKIPCNLSNPSPQKLLFLRSLPYILRCKTQGSVLLYKNLVRL